MPQTMPNTELPAMQNTTSSATPINSVVLSSVSSLINLADLSLDQLRDFFVSIGEKSFHAQQVIKWIHQQGVIDFAQMTDLSKALRAKLQAQCEIKFPPIVKEEVANDGTYKWLVKIASGSLVETVFIPGKTRGTLCVSSQAGCMLNCSFCHTGYQGFNSNLTTAEIIGQVWQAARKLQTISHVNIPVNKITNVVMMGMGEPLLNFAAVTRALVIMRDDHAYGLSKRRVTLSTSGVVPAIAELAAVSDVALAISLHAPNDELRNKLVPLNKKYPIATLIAACKAYITKHPQHKITIEYVMLAGVNDSIAHAKQLIKVLANLPSKVNLIPFNKFVGTAYQCSDADAILAFAKVLIKAGFITTIRTPRGQDISAACGQLAGKVQDKTLRKDRARNNFNINF